MDLVPSPTPLTDKALSRLRALARGNGIDSEKIVLTAGEEKVYHFDGKTSLTPLFETQERRYYGPPQGNCQKLPSFMALHTEAKKREADFKGNPAEWIKAVFEELRMDPGEGWGLEGTRVELHKRCVVLASSEPCGTCRGARNLPCTKCYGRSYEICIQCHGQKQEFCFNCGGTGHNPHMPEQLCATCHGNRFVLCRLCHGTGQTACPVCHARGKTPCVECRGMGEMTEEIHITCGATTHFSFKGEDLPSGLRRGLDRIGLANLAKGHANIRVVESAEEPIHDHEDDYKNIPGGLIGVAPGAVTRKTPERVDEEDTGFGAPRPAKLPGLIEPVLYYKASMPFADLRVDFDGRKAVIGIFGLRNVFLDVPTFLDDFLTPALEKLREATQGHGSITAALEIRALREALELNLQGKGGLKEFRQFYPIGVSKTLAENILISTQKSIKRLTLHIRAVAALSGCIFSAGIYASCFYSSLPSQLPWMSLTAEILVDCIPLLVTGILSWLIINFAVYFDLRRRFPDARIGLWHMIGKIGYGTVVANMIIWALMLELSPIRPRWLPPLMH